MIVSMVIVMFFSVILHEIAHGWVALKFGDPTAKEAGRLTLNPIPHIDPIGTILLPAMMMFMGAPIFGWAKPVPVEFGNLKPNRLGMICVSLAGIATNFILAIVAALILRFSYNWLNSGDSWISDMLGSFLVLMIFVNIVLGLFNLLPIPPLDGSRLVTMWLPLPVRMWFERMSIFFIFLILVLSPYLQIGIVISTVFQWLTGIEILR